MSTSNKELISQTLANRMMHCIVEYEKIKNKSSDVFTTVKEYCVYHKFSHQNFMKIYCRYKMHSLASSVIPQSVILN